MTRHERLNAIRKSGLCYLCGEAGASTTEHVVPACFYPGKLPNDVITLPAHGECNRVTHLDEEAFRDFMAAGIPPEHPAFSLWERTWRSIKRPGAKRRMLGYFRSFLNRFEYDKNGKRVAHPQMTTLPTGRVNRVLAKIVRGLYYLETGELLPAQGLAWSVTQLERGDSGPPISANNLVIENVLSAKLERDSKNPLETLWLISLFGVETFMVSTALIADASRDATIIDWTPPSF